MRWWWWSTNPCKRITTLLLNLMMVFCPSVMFCVRSCGFYIMWYLHLKKRTRLNELLPICVYIGRRCRGHVLNPFHCQSSCCYSSTKCCSTNSRISSLKRITNFIWKRCVTSAVRCDYCGLASRFIADCRISCHMWQCEIGQKRFCFLTLCCLQL